MKPQADQILGKRIAGVVIKENRNTFQPNSQLFLLFDDGTSYEFYSDDGYINSTGSIGKMSLNDILHDSDERSRVVLQVTNIDKT